MDSGAAFRVTVPRDLGAALKHYRTSVGMSQSQAAESIGRNSQDLWMGNPSDYAATSFSLSSDRSAITPFSKTTPARTRATSCGALMALHRVWADSISL
jgi:hypothetical protein